MSTYYEQRQTESVRHDDLINDSYDTTISTTYRSSMNPRTISFQRVRPTGLNIGDAGIKMSRSYSSTLTGNNIGSDLVSLVNMTGISLGGDSIATNRTAIHINVNRLRDKRNLEELNDKFAQYVEKVRFLEAQNRKLTLELRALRTRSEEGSSRIKEIYDIEIAGANKIIDVSKTDGVIALGKALDAEKQLKSYNARYNDLSKYFMTDMKEIDEIQKQIIENEAQVALYRRRMSDLEDELGQYKKEVRYLTTEINKIQYEIQNEYCNKSLFEVEKYTLENELAVLKQQHESSLAELCTQNISADLDPSQFFRNELSQAIREIRKDYDATIENQRNELQNRYSVIISEITMSIQRHDATPLFDEGYHREVERTRTNLVVAQNQSHYLRAKNQQIQGGIDELQRKIKALRERDVLAQDKAERDIRDARLRLARADETYANVVAFKTSLEKEIATYRGYLESPDGLRGCVDRIVQNIYQQTADRPTDTYNQYLNYGADTTATISRTFIHTSDSNDRYRSSKLNATIDNVIDHPTAPPSQYQTYTGTYRVAPVSSDMTSSVRLRQRTGRIDSYQQRHSHSYDYLFEGNANRVSIGRDGALSARSSLLNEHEFDDYLRSEQYDVIPNS